VSEKTDALNFSVLTGYIKLGKTGFCPEDLNPNIKCEGKPVWRNTLTKLGYFPINVMELSIV
jgi:hypothetical protein